MSELSPAFRRLAEEVCPTCGGPMPCALHDAALREAMLRPPEEREGVPWERLVRRELYQIGPSITSFHVRGDGTYTTATGNGELYLIAPDDPARTRCVGDFAGGIQATGFLPDGQAIVLTEEGEFYAVDPSHPVDEYFNDRKLDGRFSDAESVSTLYPIADNVLLIGTYNGELIRVEASQPDDFEIVGTFAGQVRTIIPRGDGTFLIAEYDGDIAVFDPAKPKGDRVRTIGHSQRHLFALALLPDGVFLIGNDQGNIVRFDPEKPEGEREEVVTYYGAAVHTIVATSDHAFVVSGQGGILAEYAIPERDMAEWRARKAAQHERKVRGSDVPPMPDV